MHVVRVIAALVVAVGCSSSSGGGAPTDSGTSGSDGGDAGVPASGGAHFEIVASATTDPTLKCDAIGVQADVATPDKKLIVDGVSGAVACTFDASHFSVQVVSNTGASLTASGTIAGGASSDANVTLAFVGSTYANPTGTPCTITFVCSDPSGCGTGALPSGTSIEGHFLCPEVDNEKTAKECAVTGTNPAGISNSYFKLNGCKGF